ncbi:unnamed protein product [Lymnaea stagnalis]|uniref:Uncharacterized protein n=1 Tax=Lymnaea stagnalis TaxID=6523 RepID=A0AAV2I421_LYMST
MGLSLLCGVWILACVGGVYSAVSIGIGPCPGGRKPGDKWYLPGCQECVCSNGSYSCASCGSVHVSYDPKKCYVEYPKTSYPDCCVPQLLCRGQPGFSKVKLAAELLKADVPLSDAPANKRRRKTKAKNKAVTLTTKVNRRKKIVRKNKEKKLQYNNNI